MSMSSYTTISASWPQETRTYKPIDDVFDRFFIASDGRIYAEWNGETKYSETVLNRVIALFGRRLDAVAGLDLHCHYETGCVDDGFFECDLEIEDGVCKYKRSEIAIKERPMDECPIAITDPDLEVGEDKEGFVNALNEALIKHGNGRYDHLMDHPVRFESDAGMDLLRATAGDVDVTCDSLTSIMREFSRLV